ncbi:M48 family metalloprotease [Candidatus Woesearchaeota archaeon]|nr:M48 family metalloprotease [Candidatus Woesearchaeota archaeon]
MGEKAMIRLFFKCLALIILPGAAQAQEAGEESPAIGYMGQLDQGLLSAETIEERYGVATDPRINSIVEKILKNADCSQSRAAFFVISQKSHGQPYEKGPGTDSAGNTYIPRDWIDLFKNDDDALAALVGHELAHHCFLHHFRAARRQALADELESKFNKSLAEEAYSKEQAQQLKELMKRLSKSEEKMTLQQHEFEADEFGALWSLRSGYKLAGAFKLLEILKQKYGELAFTNKELLPGVNDASHPPISRRVENLKKMRDKILETVKLFSDGVEALKRGDYNKALPIYLKILKFFPTSASAHNNLGYAYHLKYWATAKPAGLRPALLLHGEFEQSLLEKLEVAYRGADERDPGTIYLNKAIWHYRAALEINPADFNTKNNLAAALYNNGNLQVAIGMFESFENSEAPSKMAVLRNLGLAYKRKYDGGTADKSETAQKGLTAWRQYLEGHQDNDIQSLAKKWEQEVEAKGGQK